MIIAYHVDMYHAHFVRKNAYTISCHQFAVMTFFFLLIFLFTEDFANLWSGQPVRRYEKVVGSDPEDMFTVAPITGQVSLNSRLDYEASETKVSCRVGAHSMNYHKNMKEIIRSLANRR